MASRKTILELVNKYSFKLYYLLVNNKLKTKDLYKIIKTKDKELLLSKQKLVTTRELNQMIQPYSKEDCIDEILFLTDNRFRHLKEIRNLVNIDDVVSSVVTDNIYLEKINIHYTDLIIDMLVEDFYDYQDIQLLSNCKLELIELDSKINHKLIGNIDRFYIKKITI